MPFNGDNMMFISAVMSAWLTLTTPFLPEPILIGFGQFYSNRRRVSGYQCVDTGLIHNGKKLFRVDDRSYPADRLPVILES